VVDAPLLLEKANQYRRDLPKTSTRLNNYSRLSTSTSSYSPVAWLRDMASLYLSPNVWGPEIKEPFMDKRDQDWIKCLLEKIILL
jgi:hypothetical protein